ncbi:hypothetical protein LCGC14_2288820 [marine sediment metagenome]|uniref:Uncharacterized protein n=1 Tax=marine sediment metagenome TaxID=412755 RepID=A0A0F9F4C7_9ZZZZ
MTAYDDSATIITLLSTELDSLADVTRVLGASKDPLDELWGDFELALTYAVVPSAGTIVAEVALLVTVDGTNFPAGSATLDPQEFLIRYLFESRLPSTSVIERLIIPGVPAPARNFKAWLKNTAGQAYSSSGNTLKFKPYKTD